MVAHHQIMFVFKHSVVLKEIQQIDIDSMSFCVNTNEFKDDSKKCPQNSTFPLKYGSII